VFCTAGVRFVAGKLFYREKNCHALLDGVDDVWNNMGLSISSPKKLCRMVVVV
jgi:hypothetical protein